MEMQDVLTTVNGNPITVGDVIVHLKINGVFRNAIYQVIEAWVIESQCQEMKVRVPDKEIYDYAATKRRLAGLSTAVDLNRYCKWHGILTEQWNDMVRQDFLRQVLLDKIVTDADVSAYFDANKNDFLMANLSRIVCVDAPEADRVKRDLQSGGDDFASMARRISIEKNTRQAGGYLGCIKRGYLSPEIDEAVFSSEIGAILGPFQQGGYWTVYKIEAFNNNVLDEALIKSIRDLLFHRWLHKAVLQAQA